MTSVYPGAASAKIALTKASSGVVLPLLMKSRSPLFAAAVASPDSLTTFSQVLPALRSASRLLALAWAAATWAAVGVVAPALTSGTTWIWKTWRLSTVVASVVTWAVIAASVGTAARLVPSCRMSSVSMASSSATLLICCCCWAMYWSTCCPWAAEMWFSCTLCLVRDSASLSLKLSILTRSLSWSLVMDTPFTVATAAQCWLIQVAAPAPTSSRMATTTMRPKPRLKYRFRRASSACVPRRRVVGFVVGRARKVMGGWCSQVGRDARPRADRGSPAWYRTRDWRPCVNPGAGPSVLGYPR